MVASAIRYAAVYHPLWHRRQWRIGHRALPVILLISVVVNIFLLFTVKSNFPNCTETSLFDDHEISRFLHATEITWSFFLPVCMTTVLDFRVLFLKPPRLPHSPDNQIEEDDASSAAESLNRKQTSRSIRSSEHMNGVRSKLHMAVCHWMFVTSIGLLLNLPDMIVRVSVILNLDESNFVLSIAFILTARLMYFAQFGVSASYLSLVVFRKSTKSHASNLVSRAKKQHVSRTLTAALTEEAL